MSEDIKRAWESLTEENKNLVQFSINIMILHQ